MGKKTVLFKKTLMCTVLWGVIFMYFLAPYNMSSSVKVNFLIGVLIILFSLFEGHLTKKRFLGAIFIIAYLILVTLYAGIIIPYRKEIDLGVFLIIVSVCIFCANNFHFPENRSIYTIISILDIIVIIWGFCFILKIDSVTTWTKNIYGVSGDSFFNRSILLRKPVLSLRFHGQAGYAYLNLFFLNYLMICKTLPKKIYNMIMAGAMFVFIVYAVCLQSNSGYVAAFLMAIFMTRYYFKILGSKVILIWIPVIAVVFYILISKNILFYAFQHALTGKNNGILGRYSGLYAGNITIILNYFACGIYTILDYTFMSDSGFVVALTRGNIIFVIIYYCIIWKFLKANFSKDESILIAGIFIIYEFAYTFLIGRYNGLYWMLIYKICLDAGNVCQKNRELL